MYLKDQVINHQYLLMAISSGELVTRYAYLNSMLKFTDKTMLTRNKLYIAITVKNMASYMLPHTNIDDQLYVTSSHLLCRLVLRLKSIKKTSQGS